MTKTKERPVNILAKRMGLSEDEMSEIVVAHNKDQTKVVELLFLLYSRLANRIGRDPGNIGSWLRSTDEELEDVPFRLMKSREGFSRVIDFLGQRVC